MNNTPIINADLITKYYGDICALDHFSVNIHREINGLIGPNGSGKSTFLNIVMGLMKPTEGIIEVFGMNPLTHQENLKKMGVLPENTCYPLKMTVERYISHILRLRGESIDEARKMLNLLDVPFNRSIGGLSAGMYQKLGIVIALTGSPELVILDEPTANLDPISRKTILDMIHDYHRENDIAFIISTHILSELESIAQRLTILNEGKLLIQENPAVIRKQWRKIGEFNILITETQKFCNAALQDSTIKVIEQRGDRLRIKFTKSQSREKDLERLIQIVHDQNIELLEISDGCTVEEIFRRIIDERTTN